MMKCGESSCIVEYSTSVFSLVPGSVDYSSTSTDTVALALPVRGVGHSAFPSHSDVNVICASFAESGAVAI